MAQNKISLNLSAADFALSYSFKGPSVIIPGQDQNAAQAQTWWTGNTPQRGMNIPQVAYCENTVPTAEGYRSVAYRYFVEPPEDAATFVKIMTVFDGNGSSCLVGVTTDRRLLICSAYTAAKWVDLPIPLDPGVVWSDYEGITNTNVVGKAIICIRGIGLFVLDVPGSQLNAQAVTGLNADEIKGVASAKGYLVAYEDTLVYWSSAADPFDFTPSLITGAGSATPEGIKGKITLCKEIDQGFIIYCDACIISAAYSSNKALPWVFAVLSGGAGIRHEDAVAYDINMLNHFAWTSAGLIGVELHQANPILPQVTDFIASGISDATVTLSAEPTTSFDPRSKEVRLAMISNRYVCISFGYLSEKLEWEPQVPKLEQSFVWDTQLKRWGKLNVNHIQIFEAPFGAAPPVFFLTSKPYPINPSDSLIAEVTGVEGQFPAFLIESVDLGFGAVQGISWVEYIYGTYDGYEPEEIDVGFGAVEITYWKDVVQPVYTTYTVAPDELQVGFGSVTLSDWKQYGYITYSNWPAESVDVGLGAIEGTWTPI
jgi:hypothetical protein